MNIVRYVENIRCRMIIVERLVDLIILMNRYALSRSQTLKNRDQDRDINSLRGIDNGR